MAQRATTADLLRDGQAALEAGDKLRAERLFRSIIASAPEHIEAWLWLSGAVEPPEALRCLRRVLALDPSNSAAQQGLRWFQQSYGVVEFDDAPAPAAEFIAAPPAAPSSAPATNDRQASAAAAPPRAVTPSPPARATANPAPSSERTARAVPPSPARPTASAAVAARPAATTLPAMSSARATARVDGTEQPSILEWAAYVALAGSLFGLTRLVVALRPTALLIGRGAAGPITLPGALGLALAAALSFAAPLVVAWWLLAARLARLRNDRPRDPAASHADAGRALLPCYGAALGLGLALLGVGWSDQRWLPMLIGVLACVAGSLTASVRRLLALRAPLRMTMLNGHSQLRDLLVWPGFALLLGWWVASQAVVWLLHHS